MFKVQGTLGKTVITYECDTITEVRSKLRFIKMDKEKYGRKWTKVKVIAVNADVTRLF